MYNIKL